MFLIHKHSILQKWNPSDNVYSELLAVDVSEGDWIRGYDLFTQKYTRHKIVSKINLMARTIKIKTSAFQNIIITEDCYIASTSGIWCHRSSFKNVKLFKKPPQAGMLTPKPLATRFEELELFVSLATEADTMLVDDYIYVTKDWNGLKIKSVGGTGAPESVDAGQGTESGSGSSESGT
jgi:hypothetical protein